MNSKALLVHQCQGFFPRRGRGGGGVPLGSKNVALPPTDCHPNILTRACPHNPQSFVTKNVKTAPESSILSLKHQILLWGVHFFPQRTIFSSSALTWLRPQCQSPPSNSIPDGDCKLSPKAVPPPKILWKTLSVTQGFKFKTTVVKMNLKSENVHFNFILKFWW